MSFKLKEIREILGDAYTDAIATKLVELHRTVVDPIMEQLDDAKHDAEKFKAEAEKVPGLKQQLDEAKQSEDWKAKYEKEKADHDAYKAQVQQDAVTAKVKAAYRKLLVDGKISEKTIDTVMEAMESRFGKMKLAEDGSLDGADDLKKEIDSRFGGFKVVSRQRGEKVDNPPPGAGGGTDNSIRERMAENHAKRYGQPQQPATNKS